MSEGWVCGFFVLCLLLLGKGYDLFVFLIIREFFRKKEKEIFWVYDLVFYRWDKVVICFIFFIESFFCEDVDGLDM